MSKTKRHVLLALAAFFLLVFPATEEGTAQAAAPLDAYIVSVDGMDPLIGFLPVSFPSPTRGYLKDALLGMNLETGNSLILSFGWSGRLEDTRATLAELRAYLRQVRDAARARGARFLVAGHSWGTLLTYLALSYESTGADPLRPDLYVTLASPLGSDKAHGGTLCTDEKVIADYVDGVLEDLNFSACTGCRPLAAVWLNYWTWGDVISGPLATLPGGARDRYFGDPASGGCLTRNTAASSLGGWHLYLGLIKGNVPDNTDIRGDVGREITRAVGAGEAMTLMMSGALGKGPAGLEAGEE